MHFQQQLLSLLLVSACLIQTAHAAGRVVQLITENPSAFVAADPNDPQYLVTLFDEEHQPSELPQAAGMLRHMLMTDAAGQRYNCSLPGSPSHLSSSGTAQQASQQTAAGTAASSRTPFDLLDSLMGLCLYRQDGLWTYEVCHKKHVRQFRQDTAKGKEDFSCGEYSGDDVQTETILEDASSSGYHMKYVSHVFSGGADCLLTGSPRTAEVRYTCARDTKENVVVSVKEFPTCNYVVVVSTPFLCKHPAFLPPPQDLRLISCLAIDEQGQAVIKELQALAAGPKRITDGSKQAAAGVQTARKVAAASPAAAGTPPTAAGTPPPPAAAAHTPPAGKSGRGLEDLPDLVQDSSQEDAYEDDYLDEEEGARDEL